MTLRVIIAARGGSEAKSRLSGRLDGRERAALAQVMLADMLAALGQTMARVYVVTPTPELARIAAAAGAVVVLEAEPAGLNGAFDAARRRIAASDPDAVLALLPGDLPLLDAAELQTAAARVAAGVVVIVPALADGGTGAILHPARLSIPLAFGRDSYARHRAAALALGCEVVTLPAPGLAFDVDRPEDLDRLATSSRRGETVALARAFQLTAGAAA